MLRNEPEGGRLPLAADRREQMGFLLWVVIVLGSTTLSAFTPDPDVTGLLRIVSVSFLLVLLLICVAKRWEAVRRNAGVVGWVFLALAAVAGAVLPGVTFSPQREDTFLRVALVATVAMWLSVAVVLLFRGGRSALSLRALGLAAAGTVLAWLGSFYGGVPIALGNYSWDVIAAGTCGGLVLLAFLYAVSSWNRRLREP